MAMYNGMSPHLAVSSHLNTAFNDGKRAYGNIISQCSIGRYISGRVNILCHINYPLG